MGEISLADIARGLDAMLDRQMTVQARVVAHLVAAAEASGHDAAHVTATLDGVAARTALDEVWITDGQGFAYITNVRGEGGAPVPFRFDPDPAVQPQASAFHRLLACGPEVDDVVAQRAQVREIDREVYKYVGVNGVDRRRIVQVGSALAFEEQAASSNAYASPVMTAVMAAFGEPELLRNAFTSRFAEIRIVLEEILGHQMIAQATLVDHFVAAAEAAGWPAEAIDGALARSAGAPAGGEIRVLSRAGDTVYAAPPASRMPPSSAGLPPAEELARLGDDAPRAAAWPAAERTAGGAFHKHAAVARARSPQIVLVSQPLDDASPVSPGFTAGAPPASG